MRRSALRDFGIRASCSTHQSGPRAAPTKSCRGAPADSRRTCGADSRPCRHGHRHAGRDCVARLRVGPDGAGLFPLHDPHDVARDDRGAARALGHGIGHARAGDDFEFERGQTIGRHRSPGRPALLHLLLIDQRNRRRGRVKLQALAVMDERQEGALAPARRDAGRPRSVQRIFRWKDHSLTSKTVRSSHSPDNPYHSWEC